LAETYKRVLFDLATGRNVKKILLSATGRNVLKNLRFGHVCFSAKKLSLKFFRFGHRPKRINALYTF
jgi:hypothetical protein